ncbi:Isochorismatase-like protein [Aspergillus oleicola]
MDSPHPHSVSTSYQQSGFSNRMNWGPRPALLLIDICKAYFTPASISPLSLLSNPSAASSPDSMRRLLSAAREGGVPVIWSQVEYVEPDMSDAGLFWNKAKVLDVWYVGDERGLAGDLEGLVPDEKGGEVVVKKKFASAFFGTGLDLKLKELDIDTLVICGVSTSGCVRATTLDAMQYGFRPMWDPPAETAHPKSTTQTYSTLTQNMQTW